MNFVKKLRKKNPRMYWGIVSFLAICLAITFFILSFNYIRALFFIIFFILIGAFSMWYHVYIKWTLGMELVFSGTVLCSIAYGPLAGAIVGFFGLFLGKLLTMRISPITLLSLIGIIIVGIVAHFIFTGNVSVTGITLLLAYNIILLPLYYMMGGNPIRILTFSATHLLFNWWMLSNVAPMLLKLMM
tara:strand:- start:183 stop:743 length:561 start_codon:yes stop_codon:yes gene_type:complete